MKLFGKHTQKKEMNSGVFPSVEWLSYHIPKTAGTSFYLSLEGAFKKENIFKAYNQNVAALLSDGNPVEIPSNIKIIHGHFKPHFQHNTQFPNAKKIIWVRDPIERLWSLLRHWTTYKKGRNFTRFEKKHMASGKNNLVQLFDLLVNDEDFYALVNVYRTQFEFVNPKDFTFVGKAEDFNNELKKLGEIMGQPLNPFMENRNAENKTLPFKKSDYKMAFEKEYEFLRKYCNSDYEF